MASEPATTGVSRLLDLAGQKALVTGAGGGIGREVAATLVEAGAAVALHSRPAGPGEQEAAELAGRLRADGGIAVAVTADLTDPDERDTLVERAAQQLGGIDILINNAGDNAIGPNPPVWEHLRAVNIDAVVALSRQFGDLVAAGPNDPERPERERGAIVNVASIEGHQPARGRPDYATTKAAVLMWSKALAVELGPLVRVNSVSPGLIDCGGLEQSWPEGAARWHNAAPLARMGRPADVANACLFLVSPMASWITGADLVVDGGVLACPTW